MRLLIDADSAIYKAGCSNETREYLVVGEEGQVLSSHTYKADAVKETLEDDSLSVQKHKTAGEVHHSIANLKRIIEPLLLDGYDHEIYIGGKGNFRYKLYPQYKGKRSAEDRPIHELQLREYLIKHYGAIAVHGEEADDRVSWESCLDPNNCVIVSIDKDLDNTPGMRYNYDKDKHYELTLEEANHNFAIQLLTGDPTDNIPGLPRVGKHRAASILPYPTPDWLEIVRNEYHERGFDDDYLVMNGRLLWMRRKPFEMWDLDYQYGD